jgi:uncharacterized membrane protein YhaH (DUF805 family)
MYNDVQQTGRVGRTDYWIWFGLTIVTNLALLGFGIYEIVSGGILFGIMLLLLVFPLGIYFRVIMMRRCRDINWPAFLPWVLFGLGMVVNLFFAPRPSVTHQVSITPFLLPLFISLLDFLFTIVIGCIPTAVSTFNYETEYEKYAREYGVKTGVTSASDNRASAKSVSTTPAVNTLAASPQRPSFGRKSL